MERKARQPQEIAQQMMFSHVTGVNVLLSPDATQQVVSATREGTLPSLEGERLRAIAEDGNMKKRYPTVEEGVAFMRDVDYSRREELLGYAKNMTDHIVEQWQTMQTEKPIAVLLFGSVAKGLVKSSEHPDPSNIDLTVIGNITDEERDTLYELIRSKRQEVQQTMLKDITNVNSDEENPGNVGVLIQDRHKVINGDFNSAINLIASSAFPLHDEAGIWHDIEQEALSRSFERTRSKRKVKSIARVPSTEGKLVRQQFILNEAFYNRSEPITQREPSKNVASFPVMMEPGREYEAKR